MARMTSPSNLERAAELLGVAPSAGEAELRAAYLKKVQLHPPDRDPDHFELIRDAYEQLRNPAVRAQGVLLQGPNPAAPLSTLLDGLNPTRTFIGIRLWTDLLKEKRS